MDHQWLAQEFRSAAGAALDVKAEASMDGLRVTHVEAGPAAFIRFEGAPVMQVDRGAGLVPVDSTPIVQAIAWTLERRARRFANRETYGEGDVDWAVALRARFPGRFECEVSPGPGWADLIFAMGEQVEALAPGNGVKFSQVKEKFGTLRAYNFGSPDVVSDLVDAFEAASAGICETCGGPGTLRRTKGSWYLTACEEHAKGGLPLKGT
jgi:hypothetical protein